MFWMPRKINEEEKRADYALDPNHRQKVSLLSAQHDFEHTWNTGILPVRLAGFQSAVAFSETDRQEACVPTAPASFRAGFL
jgi:hypothetical protein